MKLLHLVPNHTEESRFTFERGLEQEFTRLEHEDIIEKCTWSNPMGVSNSCGTQTKKARKGTPLCLHARCQQSDRERTTHHTHYRLPY
jgi:hypothetical protein